MNLLSQEPIFKSIKQPKRVLKHKNKCSLLIVSKYLFSKLTFAASGNKETSVIFFQVMIATSDRKIVQMTSLDYCAIPGIVFAANFPRPHHTNRTLCKLLTKLDSLSLKKSSWVIKEFLLGIWCVIIDFIVQMRTVKYILSQGIPYWPSH